jgi:CRISPR-associated protein Csb2
MLALAVRYLTGRVVAADPASREVPEWPPHPGRLFMALVAAWGETGQGSTERAVLEKLEKLDAPALHVPAWSKVDALKCFVPVNDVSARKSTDAHRYLPSERGKAERHFPSVIPHEDTVCFIWPQAEWNDADRRELASLCDKVTYLGHSRTLVQVRVLDDPPTPNLVPVEAGGTVRLRIATPGRFETLRADFAAGRRPDRGSWHSYAPLDRAKATDRATAVPSGGDVSGRFLVLRRAEGPALALVSTLRLTEAMRGAVLAAGGQQPPVPEVLSGHDSSGGPSRRDHVAYVPLPDVDHPHADGHLLGLAAVLPPNLDDEEQRRCLVAIGGVATLTLGALGVWELASVAPGADPRRGLDLETWTRPARRWATVTPIVLDRYPKQDGDAEQVIATACERAGLPRPIDTVAVPVSPFTGVPARHDFPAAVWGKGAARRWHTHAIVTFAAEIPGPVLLGGGRFRGYGFCRPLGGR